ncbi:MAG TPA: RluA family pseudouridine synthase [Vicinamibacterales bacterium]|nr:RluA family pseudouridine synthase [Vicinamibacterales bacterium]
MSKLQWIVERADAGEMLDKYLGSPGRLGSRSRAAKARASGKVFVNGAEAGAKEIRFRLKEGDEVRVWEDRPGSAKRRAMPFTAGSLRILYEDPFLIVLNKPAGLLAVPLERRSDETSIFDQIEDHMRSHGKRKPLVVHRIDRDTSGVVLFAKDGRTQAALKQQFRSRTPERVYLAVVYGHPEPPSGTWRDHLVWDTKALIQKETHPRDPRAAEAISDYRTVERFETTSVIEVRLTTGKRNQIRIQSRLRGHTLVGEVRYTFGPDHLRPIAFKRQALHAWRLGFDHPVEGKHMMIEAPLADDMKKLVSSLRRGET